MDPGAGRGMGTPRGGWVVEQVGGGQAGGAGEVSSGTPVSGVRRVCGSVSGL